MFGYVRPALALLPEEDREAYQGAYCGMCHAMGRRYGALARFTLNYDFAFLGILLTGAGEQRQCPLRCPAHPLKKPQECLASPGLDAAADGSMILAYHKLRDDVADKGFFAGVPARFLSLVFRAAFRRASAAQPAFARAAEEGMARLRALEAQRSPELDRAADAFASILRGAALEGDEGRRRALGELLYHMGRWIYLVDAWDDLARDRRTGAYNPLSARFSGRAEQERDYVSATMTHSLSLAISAANLLELGRWDRIVRHMLCQSMPAVQLAVLDGIWKKMKKQKVKKQKQGESQ